MNLIKTDLVQYSAVGYARLLSTCYVGMPRAITTPQHLHKNEQSGLSFTVTHNSARWRGHHDSVGVLQTAHLHLFRSVASFIPLHAIMCSELNDCMWRVATNLLHKQSPTADKGRSTPASRFPRLEEHGVSDFDGFFERPQVERITFASRLPSSV